MTKKFAINGTTMIVSKQDKSDTYCRVELADANGLTTVVYEKSFKAAVKYAREWEAKTAKRKQAHDSEVKAMEEIIKLDTQRGTLLSLD